VKTCPRVLVVEDNEDLRKLLCEQLAQADYEVQGVCDGIEAMVELEEKQWEVVLTDYRMPRLNGLDLLVVVTVCWPNTSVVMISGEPPDTAKRALRQGAFAWVRKPYDPAHLLSTVQDAVQHAFALRAQSAPGLRQG